MSTHQPHLADGHVRERGINRVVVGVWDLEAGIEFYSKLLGTTFTRGHGEEAAKFGVEVAFSYDAGIEMVSPLEGRDSGLRTTLDERGEGIVGVVFAVDDVDARRDAAAELGMSTYFSLDYDQDTIEEKVQYPFTRYKEHFLAPVAPLSGTVLIGEFDRLSDDSGAQTDS